MGGIERSSGGEQMPGEHATSAEPDELRALSWIFGILTCIGKQLHLSAFLTSVNISGPSFVFITAFITPKYILI